MILQHKGSSVWSIPATATVFEAIRILSEKNIGALPVLDGEQLVGIFSERDYTRKVALLGHSSRELQVRHIVSSPVISISPDDSIEEAMRLMSEKHIRHLPVVVQGKLSGMISIGDIVTWVISAQNSEIAQMEAYIAGR